jgi:hypothetical protein
MVFALRLFVFFLNISEFPGIGNQNEELNGKGLPKTSSFDVQIMVLWVVTSCSDVVGYQRFGVPCCLHLYPEDGDSMTLQTLVSSHITARCHNP